MRYDGYIRDFAERFSYPEEAKKCFADIEDRLDKEPELGAAFDLTLAAFAKNSLIDLGAALKRVDVIADKYDIPRFSLHFVFLMESSRYLKEKYKKAGIDESIFWDTMDDLRCKLLECMRVMGLPGTFVGGWFGGFFDLRMFKLGRFEFHLKVFDWDMTHTMNSGREFVPGDLYVNIHIPSTGVPLTDEVRYDSYRRAYDFFKDYFPDGKMIFGCCSWLLYPEHPKFLPPTSNILKFMSDFEYVHHETKEYFGDGWRIFGADADKPADELPRGTSLQRAFADWFKAGNKAGDAFGVFEFDGEKIIRQ